MKLFLQPIVVLLLLLLVDGKVQSRGETEKVLRELSLKYKDFLPPITRTNSKQRYGQWNETKKRTVGENIFRSLNPLFTISGDYMFQKLLSGMDCPAFNGTFALVQLKVLRRVNCEKRIFNKKCTMNNPRRVYCSWIGTLINDMPAMMLGAICFQSRSISIEEELEMGTVDICDSWRYSNTKFYRLKIPKRKSSWAARFVLYDPPVYDSSSKQRLRRGSIYVNGYTHPLNPGGRTGIVGNGMLRNMGKNKMQMLMILRNNNGSKEVLRSDHYQKGNSKASLPMVGTSQLPAEPTMEEYFHAIVKPEHKKSCSKEKLKSIIDRNRKRFTYSGYFAHPNATDNAWVETTIYLIETKRESCFSHLDLTQEGNYMNYQWKAASDVKLE